MPWLRPLRMRQILQNLLSNGVKYNQPEGWIRVRARQQDQDVVLESPTGGIGLTAEEQASSSVPIAVAAPTSDQGCSLGLAIVKKLVEAPRLVASASRASRGRGVVHGRFAGPAAPGYSRPQLAAPVR